MLCAILARPLSGAANARKSEERAALERVGRFAWLLQRGVVRDRLHSRIEVRTRESEERGRGAFLRAAFALFFGKAKVLTNWRWSLTNRYISNISERKMEPLGILAPRY